MRWAGRSGCCCSRRSASGARPTPATTPPRATSAGAAAATSTRSRSTSTGRSRVSHACATALYAIPSCCSASRRSTSSACAIGCRSGCRSRPLARSILANDACLLSLLAALGATLGAAPLLRVAPWWLGMATLALWFFYVHHQFERTWWAPSSRWGFAEAALRGSVFYDLPPLLAWFTGHIGVHHVHHLAPRVPGYRIPEALRAHPRLTRASTGSGCARACPARGSRSGTSGRSEW